MRVPYATRNSPAGYCGARSSIAHSGCAAATATASAASIEQTNHSQSMCVSAVEADRRIARRTGTAITRAP